MSKLEVDAIEPQSGTTLTIGASGDSVTLGSGASLTSPGLTLSDNILFNTASKGIYLGVTTATASNLLDDYEEGTFTPTYTTSGTDFTSVTYSYQIGKYTKIGDICYVEGRLRTDAITKGSASGNVLIGGLPFNCEATESTFNVNYAKDFLGDNPLSGLSRASNSQFFLYYRTTANGGASPLQVSDMGTGGSDNAAYFSGVYKVD
jgi:hypothetical protein